MLPYSGPNSDLGNQVDKAFDLYVKLHAKDLGDNKIELIKRDEGPPSGANARTVVTELITNDKVKLLAGFVFSPSAIAAAPLATQAKIPMLICQRRHGMDHQSVALHRALFLQHVGPGLSDGHLRGDQIRLQDRGRRLYRLSARAEFDARLQDRVRKGGRQGRR